MRDDDVDRDAGDEASDHRSGEEVGDEAQPCDPRHDHREPRGRGERREQDGRLRGATEAAPTIDAAVIAGVLLGPTDSSWQVPRSA